GCNRLIQQGAFLVTKPADIIQYYETNGVLVRRKRTKNLAKIKVSLESEEKMVYASLSLEPKDINCIAKETMLPMAVLVRQLLSLQKRGLVKEIGKNNYIKI
ncbi:MAG TPA: DNA-protecting protein DprA, partial [Lachnospiraceae bacterium]|nr:DNA-protecting protein DprA [Lachnospiraceae bacterium]